MWRLMEPEEKEEPFLGEPKTLPTKEMIYKGLGIEFRPEDVYEDRNPD